MLKCVTGLSHWISISFFLCIAMVFSVGPGQAVEITRDDCGIWLIAGEATDGLYDMYEAMGYAVATDRLWQAELYRRLARGSLAEIFGPSYLESDMFSRTIAYTEAELKTGYQRLAQDVQNAVDGYAAGFNRRIKEILVDPDLALLPFEFKVLSAQLQKPVRPARWTALDILTWMVYLGRSFDSEGLSNTGQIDNLILLQYLMDVDAVHAWDMFNDLRWTNDPDAQVVYNSVPPEPQKRKCTFAGRATQICSVVDLSRDVAMRRRKMMDNLEKINARVKMGSYAWVVSGENTRSGHPILYSGPQMGFSVPSIVLEGSLRGAGLNVSGMSVVGMPAIIIGRTPHHAWSMQVGHAHTSDYYMETAADITSSRKETIAVAGQADQTVSIHRTAKGPVIEPMNLALGEQGGTAAVPLITWRYAHWGHEFDTFEGYQDLARAQSIEAFGQGVEKIAISQHFCYADRDGHIAYWMSGRDPKRTEGEWRLPQGALAPDIPAGDWIGDALLPRPFDQNPIIGYFGGWNNKAHLDYESGFNSISNIYGPFHRAHVITDYLDRKTRKGKGKLSFEQVRDLALNITTTDSLGGGGNPWRFVQPFFSSAVRRQDAACDDPVQREKHIGALKLLKKWDGHFVEGGPANWVEGIDRADAWMLMDTWLYEVLRLTFGDELGPYLDADTDATIPLAAKNWPTDECLVLMNVLLHAMDANSAIQNSYDWFSHIEGQEPATMVTIIVAALDSALDVLGDRPWGVGQRGTIDYRHVLLADTQMAVLWQTPFANRSTYAHVVEMGPDGPVRVESMFPLGESGNISLSSSGEPTFDPHFFSMASFYDTFTPRDFPRFSH